jgi:hypothetical protein
MNNWCICWVFTHILLGILIFKGLPARRLYKSFGFKGLINGVTTGTLVFCSGGSFTDCNIFVVIVIIIIIIIIIKLSCSGTGHRGV